MPRPPTATWDARLGVYRAALGEPYTSRTSGRRRRRPVTLTYPDGTPVEKDDDAGRLEAIARLLRARDLDDARVYSPTFAELGHRWLVWHREQQRTTRQADLSRTQAVEAACNVSWRDGRRLGDLPAAEFGPAHLDAIRGSMGKASPGYIRMRQGVIIALFRWAAQVVHGREPLVILDRNPFPEKSVKLPPASRSSRPCPDWPELVAILDRLDAHVERAGLKMRSAARVNALHVRVIAERGCRPNETCELRVEQWDGASGFRMGRHKTSGKTGLAGVLPLREDTAARVRALIELPERKGPWVFAPRHTEEDGPLVRDVISHWWKFQRDAVDASAYTLYSFRNTISNHLRLAGIGGREHQLALRQTTAVADGPYRRDDLATAAEVFRRAGL